LINWICPKSEEFFKKAGVLIEECIERRRETIMKYAETRNIWEVQKLPKDS
jgi:hypothetical protein